MRTNRVALIGAMLAFNLDALRNDDTFVIVAGSDYPPDCDPCCYKEEKQSGGTRINVTRSINNAKGYKARKEYWR